MTKLTPAELSTYSDKQLASFLASLAYRFEGTEAGVICKEAEDRLRASRLPFPTRARLVMRQETPSA